MPCVSLSSVHISGILYGSNLAVKLLDALVDVRAGRVRVLEAESLAPVTEVRRYDEHVLCFGKVRPEDGAVQRRIGCTDVTNKHWHNRHIATLKHFRNERKLHLDAVLGFVDLLRHDFKLLGCSQLIARLPVNGKIAERRAVRRQSGHCTPSQIFVMRRAENEHSLCS